MAKDDIVELNVKYGLDGAMSFYQGRGGLTFVDVTNSLGTATLALQGAQLLTWAPRREKPVVWLSPEAKYSVGKSMRGGAPVCWPWFGAHATDNSFPAHGFARNVPWEVIDTATLPNGASSLMLRLIQDGTTRKFWPHASELTLKIVVGNTCEMDLTTTNTGKEPFSITQALHTYFAVGNVRDVRVHGLSGCDYFDKADGGKNKKQEGAVAFFAETDRIYFNSVADCLIDDVRWRRRIRVSKRGSSTTVVWNPWVEKAIKLGDMGKDGYLGTLCVESTNAATDVVKLAAGQTHTLHVCYSVEPLPR